MSTGSAFLVGLIVPRVLPIQVAAEFFIVSAVVTVGAVVARIGMDKSVVQLMSIARARNQPGPIAALARAVLISATAVGLVALAISAASWSSLARGAYHSPSLAELAAPVALWLACETARMPISETLRGMNRVVLATIFGDAGRNLTYLVSLLALTLLGNVTLSTLCVAAACVSGAFLVLASTTVLMLAGRAPGPALTAHATRQVILSTGPFFVASLAALAVTQGDVVVGSLALSRTDLAAYVAASKLALGLTLPSLALNLTVAPIVSPMWNDGDVHALEIEVRRLTARFALIALPVGLVVVVLSHPIMSMVFPAGYISGAWPLSILGLGSLSTLVTGPNGFVLLMTSDGRFVASVTVLVASVQVITMMLLSQWFGPVGLALGSTAGSFLLNGIFSARVASHVGIRTDIGTRPWKLISGK